MQLTDNSKLSTGSVLPADDQGRQHARVGFTLAGVDAWFARYGAWVLLAFAFCYYAQYWRSGLNLAGEGGTVAMQAMRLMEGQRPIADTFLGYNVMWFYPVVWLFKVVGPNYLALRVYFFCICTAGALVGFFTLRRATRSGLYATGIAAILILIPGMLFRNYMPFLGLLNMGVLLQAYVFAPKTPAQRLLWMALAGLVLGLTFLCRVDLGLFFSIILVGSALLFPFGVRGEFKTRWPLALAGLVLAAIMAGMTHLPVYLDARARGFGDNFSGQYTGWVESIRHNLKTQIKKPVEKPAASLPVSKETAEDGGKPGAEIDRSGLLRPPLSGVLQLPSWGDRIYALLTYLPVLLAGVILAAAGSVFLVALMRCDESLRELSLTILTSLGCALTLFPQFFFFRPDTPHLSEFMAPFLVTLGCVVWWAGRLFLKMPSIFGRGAAVALILLCALNALLYISHAMPKESAGTMAAARKRTSEFQAQNGVRVLLKTREAVEDKAIYEAVMKYSGPEDYVVCYPYAPTINFMTNRRSYEYNVYVDNATAPAKFQQDFLAKLDRYKPAVILIDNRDINKSDASRFAVWAAPSYEYVRQNYKHVGTFHRQEIYVRPDRFDSDKNAS